MGLASGLQRVGRVLRKLWRGPRWLRWLVIVGVLALLIMLVMPLFSLATTGGELLLLLVEPLRSTAVGRVIFTVLVLGAALLLLWLGLRPRWRKFRSKVAVGRFLQAEELLLRGQTWRGQGQLRKVAAYGGDWPEGFADAPTRARLRLARLALDSGEPERALRLLAKVDHGAPSGGHAADDGGLKPSVRKGLRREWVELHGRALLDQGEVLPSAIVEEIDVALQDAPDSPVLLAALAEAKGRAGDDLGAALAREQLLEYASTSAEAAGQRRELAIQAAMAWEALVANGIVGVAQGEAPAVDGAAVDLTVIRQGLVALERLAGPSGRPAEWKLLTGDVYEHQGELLNALQAWGESADPRAVSRAAALFARHPRAISIEDLLRALPMQGALLVAAQELRRRGETDKAERAARQAWRALPGSPVAAAVVADVLRATGHGSDSEQVLREGLAAARVGP